MAEAGSLEARNTLRRLAGADPDGLVRAIAITNAAWRAEDASQLRTLADSDGDPRARSAAASALRRISDE